MTKLTWAIACVLSAGLIVGLMGLSVWQRGLVLAEMEKALAIEQVKRAEAERAQTQMEEQLQQVATQAQEAVTKLKQERDAVEQSHQAMERQMRAALQNSDVTISELQGKLTVSILDRILFASGEAEIKPEGEGVLREIAGVLSSYTNRQVHVVGHTDNVPIRSTPWSRYPTNWELSTARATAAVRFLSEQAGVDPRRLGAVGYGEFHPMADNATAEGRARNRRIALIVLPEAWTASDVPVATPPSATNAPANAPAVAPATSVEPVGSVPAAGATPPGAADALPPAEARSKPVPLPNPPSE